MLRKALLIFALALLALGIGTTLAGAAGTWPMLLWGALLTAAVLFERWRYESAAGGDKGAWQETSERFIDPESGQPVHVLYNPRTGERRYQSVPRDGPPAG